LRTRRQLIGGTRTNVVAAAPEELVGFPFCYDRQPVRRSATATPVRVGEPPCIASIPGVVVWVGLYLGEDFMTCAQLRKE
jgi:hypothetical protein